jgi:hypothetical protein
MTILEFLNQRKKQLTKEYKRDEREQYSEGMDLIEAKFEELKLITQFVKKELKNA